MRSAELARLAGVSVRTLRHYHQVGILTEPPRTVSGYREYDAHDLVRVLRIRRLAALRIPLERMTAVLDETDAASGDLLEALDAELAEQIESLTEKRRLIASIRRSGGAPDLPPELAPFLGALATAGLSPELTRIDRDQSVLLAHLAGAEGMPHLARYYRRLSEPALAGKVAALSSRFAGLGPDSTDDDVADLVRCFVRVFRPIVEEFGAQNAFIDLSGASEIVTAHTFDLLNPQQRHTLEQLRAHLEG